MSDRPKRETISLEEATISNMWEIAALVELLRKKVGMGLSPEERQHIFLKEKTRLEPLEQLQAAHSPR